MQDAISDAMEQLLGAVCGPAEIRRIEAAIAESGSTPHPQPWSEQWGALLDSGFVDALVPESDGGSGLGLADVFPVAFLAGRFALPVPFVQTMLVRGVMGSLAPPLPSGPITIAGAAISAADGTLNCPKVPFGRTAEWVLVHLRETCHLLPAASAALSGGAQQLDADMRWERAWETSDALPQSVIRSASATEWRAIAACAHAALLAGSMQRVLEITVAYANERSQFGKAIGRFQAIQQQLSVMAEDVFAAKMAAQIGFSQAEALLQAQSPAGSQALRAIAVAKACTSSAVPGISAVAHAVHGAIGFTQEYDLQIYTRRLHEMRMAYGAESFWHRKLGEALAHDTGSLVDFIWF